MIFVLSAILRGTPHSNLLNISTNCIVTDCVDKLELKERKPPKEKSTDKDMSCHSWD